MYLPFYRVKITGQSVQEELLTGGHPNCGINNTIKVIKRRAYGFHDTQYFIVKTKQAFPDEKHQLNWR